MLVIIVINLVTFLLYYKGNLVTFLLFCKENMVIKIVTNLVTFLLSCKENLVTFSFTFYNWNLAFSSICQMKTWHGICRNTGNISMACFYISSMPTYFSSLLFIKRDWSTYWNICGYDWAMLIHEEVFWQKTVVNNEWSIVSFKYTYSSQNKTKGIF